MLFIDLETKMKSPSPQSYMPPVRIYVKIDFDTKNKLQNLFTKFSFSYMYESCNS